MTYQRIIIFTLACFGIWTSFVHAPAWAQDDLDATPVQDDDPEAVNDEATAPARDPALIDIDVDSRSKVELDESLTGGGDERGQGQVNPWAKGVTEAQKAEAKRHFNEGNRAYDQGIYRSALESYELALTHWKHPSIEYNKALCLIVLGLDPVSIYKALEQSLRFGQGPLEDEKFERATEQRENYRRQLALIEIECDKPGARVTLDGELVFIGPGRYEDVVNAGAHPVTVTKADHIAVNKQIVLNPGDEKHISLEIFTLEERTRYTRYWSGWVPWSVAASGAVLLGAAGGLQYLSVSNHEQFSALVDSECSQGCKPGEIDTSKREAAKKQALSAYIGYGLGGAVLATGVVMVILNQPKKIIDLGAQDTDLAVLPVLSPDHVGVSALLRF